MRLQKEEHSRSYKYRKIRALYGNRLSSQILKGVLDDAADDSVCSHATQPDGADQGGTGQPRRTRKHSNHNQSAEDQQEEEPVEKIPFKERIIIRADATWKSVFDVAILLLVGYSCISSLFYVAFDMPTNYVHIVFDWIVEVCFYTDLGLNFITEYIDPISRKAVRDLKEIAVNYCMGWFIIDFLSVFPFNSFLDSGPGTKLFRLFRLPRLLKLLDVNKFSSILKSINGEKTDTQTIIKQYYILFLYNLFRLIIIACFITYGIGCLFYFMSEKLNYQVDQDSGNTFVAVHNFQSLDNTGRLIKACYFLLTTLSTVGYGDLYPISKAEQIITLIIMMGGVAFFSFIMGKFMEIITNYQIKMGVEDKTKELMLWLTEL